MTDIYRLSEEGIALVRRRLIGVFIGISVIFLPVIFFTIPKSDLASSFLGWLFPVLLVLGLMVFAFSRVLKQQLADLGEYQLCFGPDSIVRKQPNLPDLEIQRHEVTLIQEESGGGLVIKTADRLRFLSIPHTLEGYEEVQAHLARWGDIQQVEVTPQRQRLYQMMPLAAGILGVGSFVLLVSSDNPFLIIPTGLLIIVCIFLSRYIETHSAHFERKSSWRFWLPIFPLLILVIMKILYVLGLFG